MGQSCTRKKFVPMSNASETKRLVLHGNDLEITKNYCRFRSVSGYQPSEVEVCWIRDCFRKRGHKLRKVPAKEYPVVGRPTTQDKYKYDFQYLICKGDELDKRPSKEAPRTLNRGTLFFDKSQNSAKA